MTGNTKLQAVNALTVIREQEAELCALTAERDELLARVEQLESDCETLRFKVFHKSLGNKENI